MEALLCSGQHETELLQSFQSLQDESKSNYWNNNTLSKIINIVIVSSSCTNPVQGKSFWRTGLLILLLFV